MCIKSEAIHCTTGTGNGPRTALVQTRRRAAALARTHPYIVRKKESPKGSMESLIPFLVASSKMVNGAKSSKMVNGAKQLDKRVQENFEAAKEFVEVKQECVDESISPTHVLDGQTDAFVDALVGKAFQKQREEDMEKFMKTLVHALECKRGCSDVSCTKMRLTLSHFIECRQIATGATCRLCVQLLGVVSRHSRYLCGAGPEESCPIPMCDSLRAGRPM